MLQTRQLVQPRQLEHVAHVGQVEPRGNGRAAEALEPRQEVLVGGDEQVDRLLQRAELDVVLVNVRVDGGEDGRLDAVEGDGERGVVRAALANLSGKSKPDVTSDHEQWVEIT